jgi:beta-lactamase regulating signal transducer with metallopeptidase domain
LLQAFREDVLVRAEQSKRLRVWLIVTILLAGVLAINWIALSVHIDNLRASAARSTGDSAIELRAQAADFGPAETVFAALTVVVVVLAVVLLLRMLVGRRRSVRPA